MPNSLVSRIQFILPLKLDYDDNDFIVVGTTDGEFYVKEMYKVLLKWDGEYEDKVWLLIWILKLLDRIKSFIWLMKHDRFP